MVPFGQWHAAEDSYNLNSNYAGEASGVLWGGNSYKPWPSLATSSLALAAACRGAVAARTTANAVQVYAGTATALYKFAGIATAWTDFTRLAGGAYTVATDEWWQFAPYGADLIACQGGDVPQVLATGAGTNFAALAGSPPTAKYVCTVGNFVMFGDLSTDHAAVQWSGRNASTTWSVGTNDSDAQTFPDGGFVMGMLGLDQGGLVWQTEAVRRFDAVNDRRVFTFTKLNGVQGTPAPGSIVRNAGEAYYYSTQGFQKIGVDGSFSAIGEGIVDKWFNANVNRARYKAIVGALDPVHLRIFWSFPSTGNVSGINDQLLCYDVHPGLWTHAVLNTEYIFSAASPGVTLAGLAALYSTLTAVPYPFGSDVWKGGAPGLAAFDSAHKLAFFAGSPLAATIQTAQFQPIQGRRAYCNGFRFIGDSDDATGALSVSERPQTAEVFQAAQAVNAQGIIPARASGRYMRAQITIPSGMTWLDAAGVEFDDPDLISEEGER